MNSQSCCCRFSAARFTNKSCLFPLLRFKAHIFKNVPVLICKCNIFKFHIIAFRPLGNISRMNILRAVKSFQLLYGVIHLRKHRKKIYHSRKRSAHAEIKHKNKDPCIKIKAAIVIQYRTDRQCKQNRTGHSRINQRHGTPALPEPVKGKRLIILHCIGVFFE